MRQDRLPSSLWQNSDYLSAPDTIYSSSISDIPWASYIGGVSGDWMRWQDVAVVFCDHGSAGWFFCEYSRSTDGAERQFAIAQGEDGTGVLGKPPRVVRMYSPWAEELPETYKLFGHYYLADEANTSPSSECTPDQYWTLWHTLDVLLPIKRHGRLNLVLFTAADRQTDSTYTTLPDTAQYVYPKARPSTWPITTAALQSRLIDNNVVLHVVVDATLANTVGHTHTLAVGPDLSGYTLSGTTVHFNRTGTCRVTSSLGSTQTNFIDMAWATGGYVFAFAQFDSSRDEYAGQAMDSVLKYPCRRSDGTGRKLRLNE